LFPAWSELDDSIGLEFSIQPRLALAAARRWRGLLHTEQIPDKEPPKLERQNPKTGVSQGSNW